MADISLCAEERCPVKNKCFRFKAFSSLMQSFVIPGNITESGCELFWPLNGDKPKNSTLKTRYEE